MKTFLLRRKSRAAGHFFPAWPGFRLKAGAVLLFLVGLLVGLVVTFPSSIIERRLVSLVEAEGQVRIEQGALRIGFFNIYGDNLVVRPNNADWLTVEVDSLKVSPAWLSLFVLNPTAKIDMRLWGGSLKAEVASDGAIAATATNLKFSLPLQQGSRLSFSGTLVRGEIETVVPLQEESASRIDLTLENGKLGGLLKDIALGTVVLQATGRGEAFRVPTFVSNGGDYALTGGGNLLLRQDMAESRLNLRVEIRPQASADPAITELLGLVARERNDGTYQVRIGGSLAQPTAK